MAFIKLVELCLDFAAMALTLKPGRRPRRMLKVLAPPKYAGGPATKFGQIQPLLAPRWSEYTTVFCFSGVRAPLAMLKILKAVGARIIVNQNGVYYPQWFAKGWEERNRYLARLNALAHHSFFQSQFALESYRRWVGEPPSSYSILYNPIDRAVFHPPKMARSGVSTKIRVLVFADVFAFTEPVWDCVIRWLRELGADPRLEWVFMGRVHDRAVFERLGLNGADKTVGLPVETHWNPDSSEVPQVLRSCDVAAHLIYNDVCPNKVLEALACGLPVLGLSAGGTRELVGDAGVILAVEEGYGAPVFPGTEELTGALWSIVSRKEALKTKALERARAFDLDAWQAEIRRVAESAQFQ